jgi:TRAP-type uncharacterized transport system fused permease subunit
MKMKRFVVPGIWRGYVLLAIAALIWILEHQGTRIAYAAVIGLFAIGIWIVFADVNWLRRHRSGAPRGTR